MRSVAEIERELEVVSSIDAHNWEFVKRSSRPIVDRVFAESSRARRLELERELSQERLAEKPLYWPP